MIPKITFSTIVVACLILLSACNDDNSVLEMRTNCDFVHNEENKDGAIDEWERTIMDECLANRLTERGDLERHLPGTWELVGFGHGWFHGTSQPCSKITITDQSLILEYDNGGIDTTATYSWNLAEGPAGNISFQITPRPLGNIFFSAICKDYMYGDGTFADGNMHVYMKVE